MAMLAEPRKKQKISLNPQGKQFMQEEGNKGRKLLEKMGWSEGQGLGKESKGITESIKPNIHTSSAGLGYKAKVDDWMNQNEKFNRILTGLNSIDETKVHGENGSMAGLATNTEGLAAKSKASKFRIHYGKVVESKDLSKASKKDMAAIFGKPTKNSETLVPEDSSEKKSLYNLYDFKYMSKFVSDWYLKQMLPVSVLPRRNVPFASLLSAKITFPLVVPADPESEYRFWVLEGRASSITDKQIHTSQRVFKRLCDDILKPEDKRTRSPKIRRDLKPGEGWLMFLKKTYVSHYGFASKMFPSPYTKVVGDLSAAREAMLEKFKDQVEVARTSPTMSGACGDQTCVADNGRADETAPPPKRRKV